MIILKNISKAYKSKHVLENFSCSFNKGEFNGIMGKSGAGKTTLLRILMGLEEKDSGEIINFNRKDISVQFQENRLLEDFSIEENINLVLDEKLDSEILDSYLEALDVGASRRTKVRELSGGMKRRVSLLRALVFPAETYIFDEPFKDVDGETRARVLTFTREKLRGKTLILTTHDVEDMIFLNGDRKNIVQIK